jgi:hypothetical protein
MLFEVVLYFYYFYFKSAWNQIDALHRTFILILVGLYWPHLITNIQTPLYLHFETLYKPGSLALTFSS